MRASGRTLALVGDPALVGRHRRVAILALAVLVLSPAMAQASGGISPERDPKAGGYWTLTANTTYTRLSQTATLLRTGEVLIAGGISTNEWSAELFEPRRVIRRLQPLRGWSHDHIDQVPA